MRYSALTDSTTVVISWILSKLKPNNFSVSVRLITHILKTRCTAESYVDFNMRDQYQNLSPKKCDMGSPVLLQPKLLLRMGLTPAGSSGLCPFGFCVSPGREIPQHLWAACSTLIVNFPLYVVRIFCALVLHISVIVWPRSY